MIDLFIKAYSYNYIKKDSFVLRFFNSFLRFFIRNLSNLFLPVFLKFSYNKKYSLNNILIQERDLIIVSLTTFPQRINKIWIVIECVLRQTYKPDKLILWLSKEQFPNRDILPKSLLKLEERGLEIYLCEGDLRSHKKYFYTLKQFPNNFLITIDDDFFYPSNLISDLMELHKKYPEAICCERAYLIKGNEDNLESYNNWEYLNSGRGPSFDIFQTSGGGTLYPPSSLHPEVFNKEFFLEYCKTADDVWLNMMSQLNSTKIIKSKNHFEPIPILNKSDLKLSSINVTDSQNDVQIDIVRNFIVSKYNKDPFSNLISK